MKLSVFKVNNILTKLFEIITSHVDLTEPESHWLVGCLFGCLFGWLVGWLLACLLAWLVGWFIGWYEKFLPRRADGYFACVPHIRPGRYA